MKPPTLQPDMILRTAAILLASALLAACAAESGEAAGTPTVPPASATPAAATKPALTVNLTQPRQREVARTLVANGNISAWQEAAQGVESGGMRLAKVHVDVGSQVQRGQVLAEFADDTLAAELAASRARVVEAEAELQEARANAARARGLRSNGALSAQQIDQYLTGEATAKARLESARANVVVAELRLRHARLLASDDGVISHRADEAAPGAVLQQGQTLFRLIRQNRLEWRAEVPAEALAHIHAGQAVVITPSGGAPVHGSVRQVAPTVDASTRKALVYVDLPKPDATVQNPVVKPGMFATGHFALGNAVSTTLPRQAVALRDGLSYAFIVGPDLRVKETRVDIGQRGEDWVEITSALPPYARIVGTGAGFLVDGDLVAITAPAADASNAQKP